MSDPCQPLQLRTDRPLRRTLCAVPALLGLLLVLAAGPAAGDDVAVPAPTGAPAAAAGQGAAPASQQSVATAKVGAPGGAVAAAHPLAAKAGEQVLRDGGSAFDAAITTALVLGVVQNQSSGLGGGGFAVFRAADGSLGSLDFREAAPGFFTADTYEDPSRNPARGPWSTGIPGEPAGLAELHRIGGRLPWARLVEPARIAAADGFVVNDRLAAALTRHKDAVLADEGLRADFSVDGVVLTRGQTCRRPVLAETLAYLAAHGGDAFYKGPIARSIAGFLAAQGLPWTEEDLQGYRVVHRAPVVGDYRGNRVVAMGPPSSGGLAVLQSLSVLQAAEQHAQPYGGLAWSRALAAALSHAFADRAAYGGDPDFVTVPVADLTDPALGPRLWAAGPETGPVPRLQAGLAGERGDTRVLLAEPPGTSHLSVIDGDGNAVALTTTVNLGFGSLQQDPGTGILLNDQLDDFAARPGVPNSFGLVQGDNNAPAAGKRPLSSMSPTLVLDSQDRVVLAVGAAGGPTIITGTLQAILGRMDRRLSITESLSAPRMHHQWLPEIVFMEPGFPDETLTALSAEGFRVKAPPFKTIVQAVIFDPATGTWDAAADPRGSGGVGIWNP